MIRLSISVFLLLSLFSASCQQKTENLYNENNYNETHRGLIDKQYRIVYRNEKDTNYTLHKIYPDSLYQDSSFIVFKYYFYRNVMEGPTELYSKGKLFSKGFMKGNKRHGEYLVYSEDGRLDQRQFYDMGKRVGVWEDYYDTGILFKKVFYNDGKFIKQEIYERKEGKLVRTEYQESGHY